jgi:hypothetical protein
MVKTLHGKVHGNVIEIDEEIGIADDQEVEVQVKVIQSPQPSLPVMSKGLSEVYAILGERFESGHSDTAARHNEHQP